MRILFCPSDIGGGYGHISRCIALAQYAKKQKHECAFIFHKKVFAKSYASSYKTYLVPVSSVLKNLLKIVLQKTYYRNKIPTYLVIPSLNYQVIRDGFVNSKIVEKVLAAYQEIIGQFKPDIIIGDTNLLIGSAAKLKSIPVIQLVRKGSHPAEPELIWWETIPDKIKQPEIQTLFNPILGKNKLGPIERAEDLLEGDGYLIPSIPQFEPVDKDKSTYYVGPLLVERSEKSFKLAEKMKREDKPLVYVTIGGGAGTVGNRIFFNKVLDAFKDEKINVIVSTSKKFNTKDFSDESANIKFCQWVPGRKMIDEADLVIFHGGYGTMMETVKAGKPSIIIPFHSEQESNGRRLVSNGCGKILKISKQDYSINVQKWAYGEYNILSQSSFDIQSEDLLQITKNIQENADYSKNSYLLKAECDKYGGSEYAFKIIRNYW